MKKGRTNRKIKIKEQTSLPFGNNEIILEKGEILGVITEMDSSVFLSYDKKSFWVTKEEFENISDHLDE